MLQGSPSRRRNYYSAISPSSADPSDLRETLPKAIHNPSIAPSNSASTAAVSSATTLVASTVDNLILPGVIGASIEGPKTPVRSPFSLRNFSGMLQASSSPSLYRSQSATPPRRPGSSRQSDQQQLREPLSIFGHGDEYDDESDRAQPPRHPGYGTPHTTRIRPLNSSLWREQVRPQDTPRRNEKRASTSTFLPANGRYPQHEGEAEVAFDGQEGDDDDDEQLDDGLFNSPRSAFQQAPRSQAQSSHRWTHHSPDVQRVPVNDAHEEGYESADHDGELDEREHVTRGNQTKGKQVSRNRGSSRTAALQDQQPADRQQNQAPNGDRQQAIDEDDDDWMLQSNIPYRDLDDETAYLEEEAIVEQLEREEAERQREEQQIGFIKRWARLLRKQRDEFGLGTPNKDDGESEDLDAAGNKKKRLPRTPISNARIEAARQLRLQRERSANSTAQTLLRSPRAQQLPQQDQQQDQSESRQSASQADYISVNSDLSPNSPTIRAAASYRQAENRMSEQQQQQQRRPGAHPRIQTSRDSYGHIFDDSGFLEEDQQLVYEDDEKLDEYAADDDIDLENDSQLGQSDDGLSDEHVEAEAYGIQQQHRHQTYQQEQRQRNLQTRRPRQPRVYPWHVIGRTLVNLRNRVVELWRVVWAAALDLFFGILELAGNVMGWCRLQSERGYIVAKSWVAIGQSIGLLSSGTLFGVLVLALALWMLGGLDSSLESRSSALGDAGEKPSVHWPESWQHMAESIHKETADWSIWIKRLPQRTQSYWTANAQSKDKSVLEIPVDQMQTLDDIEARIEWIQKTLKELNQQDITLDREMKSRLEKISERVLGTERKLDVVAHEIQSVKKYLQKGQWIDQVVIDLIRDEMPKYLVVTKDAKTGQLRIPVEFWDQARGLFATPDQVLGTVGKQVDKAVEVLRIGQENQQEKLNQLSVHQQQQLQRQQVQLDHLQKQQVQLEQQRKSTGSGRGWGLRSFNSNGDGWEAFLKENEKNLNGFVDSRMAKVSKREFLNLVKDEADAVWQQIEVRVISALEKHGKLAAKQHQQPRKQYGSKSAAGSGDSSMSLSELELDVIQQLIDAALEKYSADVLGKPDYALFSAGGRIIPKFTFESYFHQVESTAFSFLGRVNLFTKMMQVPRMEKPPLSAIQPDIHAGECWAMKGSQGQIGIRLARKVVVTEVTIEHADKSTVLDQGSAVKEVEIWGLTRLSDAAAETKYRPDRQQKHQQQQQQQQQQQYQPQQQVDSSSGNNNKADQDEGEPSQKPWEDAKYLTTVRFETGFNAPSRQSFSIPISKQGPLFTGVIFRIKSNWGNPDFTCLYRVRVHGYEP